MIVETFFAKFERFGEAMSELNKDEFFPLRRGGAERKSFPPLREIFYYDLGNVALLQNYTVPGSPGRWLLTMDSRESRYLRKAVLPGTVSSMVLWGLWSTKDLVTET